MGNACDFNRKLRQKKLTLYCKHYTGPRHESGKLVWPRKCDAGVAYAAFDCKPLSKPCHTGGKGCSKFETMTEAEVDEQERAVFAALDRTETARRAVVVAANGRRCIGGRINCPVCKGVKTLQYSIASNGHIWGHCTTGGCVGWME